ncbi:MAG: BON domain-containing protein [Gammaproteobacteria bacterium]|jgi:osmotically-inducible protein OsmY|nr:BON domain-containing protein [Gammaproteobacteria bacterium]
MKRVLGPLTLSIALLAGCASQGDDGSAATAEEKSGPPAAIQALGNIIDDTRIETTGLVRLRRAGEGLKDGHLGVTSFRGVVLLTGQVRDEASKALASEVLSGIEDVKTVYNELTISGPTALLARSADAVVTSKVKARLLANEAVRGLEIKVVTENGTVYLLGTVTRAEGEAATAAARAVGGVERVVRIFSYSD